MNPRPAPSLRDLPLRYVYDRASCPNLLEDFYVPMLSAAVRYDRMTMTFNGQSLSVAAAGIAGLVNNDGHMRLICHRELSRDVVKAIRDGLISAENAVVMSFGDEPITRISHADLQAKHHLDLLTWLVKERRLEIKVAIPKDPSGIFHRKTTIAADANGDSIAFDGSLNESVSAWMHNDESFILHNSWENGRHIDYMVKAFELLWRNEADSSIVIPIPEALERDLIKFAPDENPAKQPALKEKRPVPYAPAKRRVDELWSAIHHAIADDPQTAIETIAAELWPHQLSFWRRHARDAAEPPRVLIADEVGLGKTIQAGALLKTFINRRQADRVLILTPATARWQWQDELRHKFNIDVPVLDRRGGGLRLVPSDPKRDPTPCGDTPWRDAHRLIMSYDWLRRNADAFFADEPKYDLVIFDESHRARYSNVANPARRQPNSYLKMLRRLSERTRGLLLLTATPMQIDPAELWALLDVLTRSRWTEEEFKQFYDVNRPLNLNEWNSARQLWKRNGIPGTPERIAELARMPLTDAQRHIELIESNNPFALRGTMNEQRIRESLTMMRRSSEIKQVVSRHTRNLLREYAKGGWLSQTVPERSVASIAVKMSERERKLYSLIRDFVRSWYSTQRTLNRQALGFVMTHFRLRLGSSRHAFERSLINARGNAPAGSQPDPNAILWRDILADDEESADYDLASDYALPDLRLARRDDLRIGEMLNLCRTLGNDDSKFQEFARQIKNLQKDGYGRIMVFSRFWDTQDWLRRELSKRPDVPNLAGLSGDQDWIYDRSANAFREADRQTVMKSLRKRPDGILLCTDTAAESLNFQFCAAMINYDIPWNPMRLEQRIGRIDRIGQEKREIRVVNLFYEGTAENDAYNAMKERIENIETNVGTLQPILDANLESIIRNAELDGQDASSVIEAVRSLPSVGSFDMDDLAVNAMDEESPPPRLRLDDIAHVLNNPQWMPDGFSVQPRGDRHWSVQTHYRDEGVVTADRRLHDYAAGSVNFFGPGNALFPPPPSPDDTPPKSDRHRPIPAILNAPPPDK